MRWIPISERMPEPAQDHGDVVYCRVVYESADRPTDRRVGYFDGGEWKDISGYKFATYGGTVTHWFEAPELDTAQSIGMQIEGWVCYGIAGHAADSCAAHRDPRVRRRVRGMPGLPRRPGRHGRSRPDPRRLPGDGRLRTGADVKQLPEQSAEEFVRMLLWDDFPECCGCPVADTGGEYMGQTETVMSCCGNPEPALLSDAQIVASLRERFPSAISPPTPSPQVTKGGE